MTRYSSKIEVVSPESGSNTDSSGASPAPLGSATGTSIPVESLFRDEIVGAFGVRTALWATVAGFVRNREVGYNLTYARRQIVGSSHPSESPDVWCV